MDVTTTLNQLRGCWHHHRGIRTLVTFHPSYLLRNPAAKKNACGDLQLPMNEMVQPMHVRRRGSGD